MVKRAILKIVKVLAGIAAVVFWLVPLRTGTQVLLFVASIVVMLLCFALSSGLNENANTGYWPTAPADQFPHQNSKTGEGQTSTEHGSNT
jgi:lipopolysaccharide export LptBFGC system permease protein LptF